MSDARTVGFFTDTSLCIGCKACQVACKQWNELPGALELAGFDPRRGYDATGALSASSWRHVAFVEDVAPGGEPRWSFHSDVCKHCEKAPCLEACPTRAIVRTEFGSVLVRAGVCNGCAYCTAACPFGVIGRSEKVGVAQKCTFCVDRLGQAMEPACAKACPTDSILFGPLGELRARADTRARALRARGQDARLYGCETSEAMGGLHAMSLLAGAPERYGLPSKPERPADRLAADLLRATLTAAGLVVALATWFA